jgi:hypothetical protein
LKAWLCKGCGKSEITRWFRPRWVKYRPGVSGPFGGAPGYYFHRNWLRETHRVEGVDCDFGKSVECGDVIITKRIRPEWLPKWYVWRSARTRTI